MATQSSIVAWKSSMDRGAWRLQAMWLQRVGHDWALVSNRASLKWSHSAFVLS